jgi:mono/diheme cytochrome c family protein
MRNHFAIHSACLAAVLALAGSGVQAGDPAAGKKVFETAKPSCKACHTDARNSLAKVGAANTADEIKAWLRTPKEMMARKGKTGVKPTFGPDKISDKDLDDLAAYLSTLK